MLNSVLPMTPHGVMTFVNSSYAYGNLYNTRRYTLVQSFCFQGPDLYKICKNHTVLADYFEAKGETKIPTIQIPHSL